MVQVLYGGRRASGKNGRTPEKNDYSDQLGMSMRYNMWSRISFNSSMEKFSNSNCLNLMSVISRIIAIFHLSSSSISLYLMSYISIAVNSSISFLLVNIRKFLRLDPVVELARLIKESSWLISQSCSGNS